MSARTLGTLGLVALVLSVASPAMATPCVLEGVFAGYAPMPSMSGVPFVALTFDAATTDCDDPQTLIPTSADPYGMPLVWGTPRLEVGTAYRVDLRPNARVGTHGVSHADVLSRDAVSSDAVSSDAVSPGPIPRTLLPVRKPGNNVPPCTQNRWRPGAMPLRMEVHTAGSDDVVGDDLVAVERAAAMWSTPSCSRAAIDVSGRYEAPAPLEADGRNTVQWIENDAELFVSLGAENVGFTCYVCDDEGFYVEADVRLNGAEQRWSTMCDGGSFDVQGAMLHEFGHVLGAPHVESRDAVMFPVTSARRLLSTRALARPDIEDMCARYPCDAESPGDCGAPIDEDEGCPAGLGLCAECTADEMCGASGDSCLLSSESGAEICGRACSGAFPCPAGYSCANVGAAAQQCVPTAGACEDLSAFVGCGCESDADCEGQGARCLDGRCAVACDGGVACPADATCLTVYDADAIPEGRWCVASADAVDPCATPRVRGCGDCAVAAPPWSTFMLVVAALFVRRRRHER